MNALNQMKKKHKIIFTILYGLIAIIFVTSVILYFYYGPTKPWLALYVAGCGGIFIVNLIIMVIFIRKNIKQGQHHKKDESI